MTAYYNEFDPYAAAWLRNLIAAGHIAPGDVDERSIEDVTPDDLRGYTQCHFFAGIGVWSLALRRAGWADDRPVWTGSCPCQPFSAAGKGAGFADERHLWPAFHWLISQRRPAVVFGEQVASKDGLGWLDLVQADLEGTGYASGAVDLCAAGVGAPHIRQRLWWVAERLADTTGQRRQHEPSIPGSDRALDGSPEGWIGIGGDGNSSRLANADQQQWDRGWASGARGRAQLADGCTASRVGDDYDARLEGQRGGYQAAIGRDGAFRPVAEAGELGGVADAASRSVCDEREQRSGEFGLQPQNGSDGGAQHQGSRTGLAGGLERTSPTNGHWRDADWLFCRDGKWRPVEPGSFPLVDGAAFRVDSGSPFAGKSRAQILKGAGNAIVADCAQTFIESYLDINTVDGFRLSDVSPLSVNEGVFG